MAHRRMEKIDWRTRGREDFLDGMKRVFTSRRVPLRCQEEYFLGWHEAERQFEGDVQDLQNYEAASCM